VRCHRVLPCCCKHLDTAPGIGCSMLDVRTCSSCCCQRYLTVSSGHAHGTISRASVQQMLQVATAVPALTRRPRVGRAGAVPRHILRQRLAPQRQGLGTCQRRQCTARHDLPALWVSLCCGFLARMHHDPVHPLPVAALVCVTGTLRSCEAMPSMLPACKHVDILLPMVDSSSDLHLDCALNVVSAYLPGPPV
jgi:hypothetical protein